MRVEDIINEKIEPGDTIEFEPPTLKSLRLRHDIASVELARMKDDPGVPEEQYTNQEHKVNMLRKKYENAKASNYNKSQYTEKITRAIKKNCSDILAAYHEANKVLHRGVTHVSKPIIYGKSSNNRTPLDSPMANHRLVNSLMKELGFDARRDNSVFTTRDLNDANAYGEVYVIFPVNGFKFTWSKKFADIILSQRRMATMIPDEVFVDVLQTVFSSNDLLKDFEIRVDSSAEYLKDSTTFSDNLKFRIFAWATHHPELQPKLDFKHTITAKVLQTHMQYDNTNLVAAIQSGHEVYITGSYYGISVKRAASILSKLGINT